VRIRSLIRNFARRRQRDAELDAEVRGYAEMLAEENMRKGMKAEEARRAARIELGGVEQVKERVREARAGAWLDSLLQDLRYGMRMLRKSPAFTAIAVVTLALGIGANTAIFSLLDAVMLKALPVSDPQGLAVLQWHGHKGPRYDSIDFYSDCAGGHAKDFRWGCFYSSPMFDLFEEHAKTFDGVFAISGPMRVQMNGNGTATMADAEVVTGDYFRTLGVGAALGRTIERSDDSQSAEPVAVLSYGYWQSAFGGDRSAIGRIVRLNRVPVTIVGVAEPRFTRLSPGKDQDMWITRWAYPRIAGVDPRDVANAGNAWLAIMARIKAGVSPAQAQAEASLIFRNEMVHGSHPLMDAAADPGITLIPAQEGLTGRRDTVTTPLYLLMLAVGILLLIACANVAGLLLARSAARRREIAVRLTLGAPRARIIRQLMTESVLLAFFGGTLGVLFAYWGVHAFARMVSSSEGAFPFPVTPDARILAFTIAVSLLSGIFFGLAPAWRGTRMDLTPALKEAPGGASHAQGAPERRLGMGSSLVVAQVALAVVVLAGAGLMVRTLHNLKTVDPGFDSQNVLLFAIDPSLAGYKPDQIQDLYRNLQTEFAAVPGVTSASYSSDALLSGYSMMGDFTIDGQGDKTDDADFLLVGPRFFATMHIPLVMGRTLEAQDFVAGPKAPGANGGATVAPPVPVIVNEAFVRTFCGTKTPLGMRLRHGLGASSSSDTTRGQQRPAWEIVGVAADAKYSSLRKDVAPTLYVPVDGGGVHFEIRTAYAPESLVPAVRRIVARHDSDLPIFKITTETKQIDALLFQESLIARLSSFFGALALLLACTGIYGLLAYEVTTRTREVGIRMALGAQPGSVMRLILGRGLTVTLLGMAIGIAGAVGVTRFLQSLLFGVRPIDPVTLAAVTAVLFVVGIAACFLPARRAMRVDPMVALRHE